MKTEDVMYKVQKFTDQIFSPYQADTGEVADDSLDDIKSCDYFIVTLVILALYE